MRSVLRRIRETEDGEPATAALPPLSPPGSNMAPPSRRRAQPSERFQRLNDQRSLRMQNSNSGRYEGLVELQEASERLAQTNEDLRSLLDRPLSTRTTSNDPVANIMDDEERIHASESQHRRKRRRIEGPAPENVKRLERVDYGYDGQAIPTPLKMELRHANTGESGFAWDTNEYGMKMLQPLNHFIRDGGIPYEFRSRRVNLVLQHPEERPFTLSRIVLKIRDDDIDGAPLHGFVFATSTDDARIGRTAHYRFDERGRRRPKPHSNHVAELVPNVAQENSNIPVALASQNNTDEPRSSLRPADCEPYYSWEDSDDSAESTRPTNVLPGQELDFVSPPETDSDDGMDDNSNYDSHDADNLRNADASAGVGRSSTPGSRSALMRAIAGARASNQDAYDMTAAQFDFDEVLRRGDVTADDRRMRRAMARQRARIRHAQERGQSSSQNAPPNPHSGFFSEVSSTLDNVQRMVYEESATNHRRTLQPIEPSITSHEGQQLPGLPRLHLPEPSPSNPDSRSSTRAENVPQLTSPASLLDASGFFTTYRQGQFRYSMPPKIPDLPSKTASTLAGQAASIAGSSAQASTDCGTVTHSYTVKNSVGRISMKFDPPISARFLVMKLWRSRNPLKSPDAIEDSDENITLSQLRVEGCCGPRWLPAIDVA